MKGRVWTMVAGGGASVIYADTVGDLGYAEELGNYAEYSGAPSTDETCECHLAAPAASFWDLGCDRQALVPDRQQSLDQLSFPQMTGSEQSQIVTSANVLG